MNITGAAPVATHTQPPVWNVAQRRNIHFVGRQQMLLDLHIALGQRKHFPQALTGGGGCGKTSIALEYAYAHQGEYDIVWWVRAETPATITADLASLAPALARSGQLFDGPRHACNAALQELKRRDRWLLIFDNARQPNDLAPFLRGLSSGHVLITSPNSHWESMATMQPVNAWLRDESVQFLRARLGGLDEPQTAEQLAAALGDLPLALDQAAACISQADMTLSEYLSDFESLWAEMLGRGRPLGSYPVHAAMTWELSFRRIELLNPMAAQLLTLCGFFSPDDIPLSMIHNAASELPAELSLGLMDPIARTEALNLLDRFALAKTSDGVISIHGVIAALAQDRLDASAQARWSTIALRIASLAFPFDSHNPQSWRACADVLPHVLCSTMHAHSAGIAQREVVDMLGRTGRFLLKQGNYAEARTVLEMAHTLVNSSHGQWSGQAADIANNLARVRHRLGDLAGASALYEMALEIDRQNYGEDDPHLATVANNSAMTLVELGLLADARKRFEWVVGIYRKNYPQNHPKIASVMNNLGFVLMQLKEFAAARQWLDQSLAITESSLGTDHPQVACIAVNLAGVLRAEKNYSYAQELLDRAMQIDQAAFGTNHPAYARDLLNLAQLMSDQEFFTQSVPLMEQALDITETCFGPDHRETALCLRELARALKGLGNVARANDLNRRAAAISSPDARGKSHETVVGDEGMLA